MLAGKRGDLVPSSSAFRRYDGLAITVAPPFGMVVGVASIASSTSATPSCCARAALSG